MSDPLLRFRAEFPILETCTYLVSNSLGAMPRAVPERLAEYADAWATLGVRAWARRWWDMPVEVGDGVAPLLGAPAGSVAMVANVSVAHAAVLSGLAFEAPRDTIVTTQLDFPSVRYVLDGLGPRLGARVHVVPSDDGLTIDTGRLLEAIDERTRLVAVSHVLFRSAFIMDAAAICARAREVGALVMLDAYHSVGVVPVDVQALGVDFLTGGVLKWLCGGPGGCFLYARPGASARVTPTVTGWQAHARPFAFEETMELSDDGAWRWLSGTPSIPALHAAMDGPRLVGEAGLHAIRAKSTRQTARLIALADARGYTVNGPREDALRGGTVAIDVPHAYEVSQFLIDRDVVVDYRPGAGIRIAPHFYSTDAEVDRAIETIDEALTGDAWRAFAGVRSVVT